VRGDAYRNVPSVFLGAGWGEGLSEAGDRFLHLHDGVLHRVLAASLHESFWLIC
jgi:hypothetical protein